MCNLVSAWPEDNHPDSGYIDQMLGIAAGQIADRFNRRARFLRTDLGEAPFLFSLDAGLKPVADQEFIDSVGALRVGRLAQRDDLL